jgi:predicted O-methyltransferase YrrM
VDATTAMHVEAIYERVPNWVRGSISQHDARFLFEHIFRAGEPTVVEIGTGSGVSAAVSARALHVAQQYGRVSHDWRVFSYDNSCIYPTVDPPRPVGSAARDILDPELLSHIEFRHPAISVMLREHHAANELGIVLIDANHSHPWPSLDLLAILPLLRPGATVFLHDINLPDVSPNALWGARHLFEGVTAEKATGSGDPPNIGSIVIPEDKGAIENEVVRVIRAHAWEMRVSDEMQSLLP